MVDLTKEGYVDRTRGKGTFVRERKLVEKIQILGSFHASMERQGLRPTVTVLSSDVGPAPEDVATALPARARSAWCLRRLAMLDDDPLGAAHGVAACAVRAGMSATTSAPDPCTTRWRRSTGSR